MIKKVLIWRDFLNIGQNTGEPENGRTNLTAGEHDQ